MATKSQPVRLPNEYVWPQKNLTLARNWIRQDELFVRPMPESLKDLALDSRWPAFFPSQISLVSTQGSDGMCLERVVGASIVNRFPYVIALSFCRKALSARHYVRSIFTNALEKSGTAAVQFLEPGERLEHTLEAIASIPDRQMKERIDACIWSERQSAVNECSILEGAYLVYEGRLVQPGRDLEGNQIFDKPWMDVGSHRVYFLEITAIQLREDIARGETQILWRSLPTWEGGGDSPASRRAADLPGDLYKKSYTPNYAFPSKGTVAFEADHFENGMAVKLLPPLPEDQVEVDNQRARWPCFFPSSVGMITCWSENNRPNLMPCGSTTVLSRHPMVIAPCVSYARVNERYAPRASLDYIRARGRFGCGVPYINDTILAAINYCGNISLTRDPEKIENSGLTLDPRKWAPRLRELPIHFECEVVDEVCLGTHVMFLGEVKKILVDHRVTSHSPFKWSPFARLAR